MSKNYEFSKIPATWKWRAAKIGITMNVLADKSHVSKAHLSAMANGKANVSLKMADRIENVLLSLGAPLSLEEIEK